VGDVIVIININNHQEQAATYLVRQVIDKGDCHTSPISKLRVSPITYDKPVWGNLYSPFMDYMGRPFFEKSLVARLEVPVRYEIENKQLFRIISGRRIVVAQGVINFEVNMRKNFSGDVSYDIKCLLQTEGVFMPNKSNNDSFTTVSYTAFPRAMKNKYEYQILGQAIP
jgi:hypothetical protein